MAITLEAIVVGASVGSAFVSSSGTLTTNTAFVHPSEGWTPLTSYGCAGATLPEGRLDPGMTYDYSWTYSSVVMVGGYNGCTPARDANTFWYRGDTGGSNANGAWTTVTTTATTGTSLPSVSGGGLAYCPSQCVYLGPHASGDYYFGGYDGTYIYDTPYLLSGTVWSTVCTPLTTYGCFYLPSSYYTVTCNEASLNVAITGMNLVWDPSDETLYMFGGYAEYNYGANSAAGCGNVWYGGGVTDDMYYLTYDTTGFPTSPNIGWKAMCGEFATGTACGPGNRAYAAMAYDPNSGDLVLYGGYGCTTPSLYGCTSPAVLTDTWYFHPDQTPGSAAWTQCTSTSVDYQCPTAPSNGADAAFAYDAANGSLVLFGGCSSGVGGAAYFISSCTTPSSNTAVLGHWNGETYQATRTWVELGTLSPSPPALYGARMVFDYSTGYLVLYGGSNYAQTWIYGYPH